MTGKATVKSGDKYECAMCGGVFRSGWPEEEALAEAIKNGFNQENCKTVCDLCYKTTPWGKLGQIQKIVNQQAKDEGLWFDAQTAPEAYLQAELRKLHALIEND